jgi:hypothetical protein
MMFNILTLFSWTTWLLITIVIILIFWVFYGGRQEYEFVGVKPLSTKSLFENLGSNYNHYKDVKVNTFKMMQNQNIMKTEDKSLSCKGEDLMAEILEKILNSKIKRNIRPSFLRNPETGKNLELDCYNEEYAIAVEYNGIQHYKYPSAFHKTEKEFTDQIYRDRLKKKLCDEAGVYLISVPYWVDIYGDEAEHFNKNNKGKIFVPREVRYKRLYDYLYGKIKDYFIQIFPEEYEEDIEEDEDMYLEEDEEDMYLEEDEEDMDLEEESESEDYDEDMEDNISLSESESDNGFSYKNNVISYENPMIKKIY